MRGVLVQLLITPFAMRWSMTLAGFCQKVVQVLVDALDRCRTGSHLVGERPKQDADHHRAPQLGHAEEQGEGPVLHHLHGCDNAWYQANSQHALGGADHTCEAAGTITIRHGAGPH